MATIYDFNLLDKKGNNVNLSDFQGKVLLVVNTATECGFTPQYEDLQNLHTRFAAQGFEILDIPCNQFGGQAPGTDEEISEFCTTKFGMKYAQFKKAEVNGEGELPLYTWLKAEKPFEGFDPAHNLTAILENIFDKADPAWRTKSDIKWNFTKFLINREGQVVARFEPTHDMNDVANQIMALL
ncbi:MAG: glutathione peroxidase [Bacteroidaceae bacterium]|nr:glutathione peroxidase [Bacteroidaceae bacterium]